MNMQITLCLNCGKAVQVAPGFCILCGQPMPEGLVRILPRKEAEDQIEMPLAA